MSDTTAVFSPRTYLDLLEEFRYQQETVDLELLGQVYRSFGLTIDVANPQVRFLPDQVLAQVVLDVRARVEAARRFAQR